MPFHFSLQAILHIRCSLEHQQELRLRAANQQAARVRRLVDMAEAQLRETASTRISQLSAGMTSAELRFQMQCEVELQRHITELRRHLDLAERACAQEREKMQRAKRERETLESLHDLQRKDYMRMVARREQRALDDLFLLRRQYLQRG